MVLLQSGRVRRACGSHQSGVEENCAEESASEESVIGNDAAQKISKLLRKLEAKLGEETPKASLGDFIRLVQLEKEMAEEEKPREIKVTWVELQPAPESEK